MWHLRRYGVGGAAAFTAVAVIAAMLFLIPEQHMQGVVDAVLGGCLVIIGLVLLSRFVRRIRQREWRVTGGRMRETPSAGGGKHRSIADRLNDLEVGHAYLDARGQEVEATVKGLRVGLARTLEAAGQAVPVELDAADLEQTSPILRLVGDGVVSLAARRASPGGHRRAQ
jgi:hypothetical protein